MVTTLEIISGGLVVRIMIMPSNVHRVRSCLTDQDRASDRVVATLPEEIRIHMKECVILSSMEDGEKGVIREGDINY